MAEELGRFKWWKCNDPIVEQNEYLEFIVRPFLVIILVGVLGCDRLASFAGAAAATWTTSAAFRGRSGRTRSRFFGLFRFSVIFVFRVASLAFALLLATLVRSGVFRCRFFDLKTYDNQMNEKWQILNEDAKIVKLYWVLSTKLSFL